MFAEEISADLLATAVEKILTWSVEKDHPLNKCKKDVRTLVAEASRLAQEKRYDEAVDVLQKAAAADPKYVGSRVRMMKYLLSAERPIHALLVGGSALLLTGDARTQSQIYDMASGVGLDAFKRGGDAQFPYLVDALSLADKATRLAPENIVFAWNRLEIQLRLAEAEAQRGNQERCSRLLESAQAATADLVHRGRVGGELVSRYWRRLVDDAQDVFPSGRWWRDRLYEMDEIGKNIAETGEVPEEPLSQSALGRRKRRMLVIAILVALALGGGFGGHALFPDAANPPVAPTQPLGAPMSPDSLELGTGRVPSERLDADSDDLARLDLDDVDLARLDLDDDHLAWKPDESMRSHSGLSDRQRDLARVQMLLAATMRVQLDDDDLV